MLKFSLFASFIACTCLWSHDHHPSESLGHTLLDKEDSAFNFSHQSSFTTNQETSLIGQINLRHIPNHWLYFDLGLGARAFSGNYGVGWNMFGSITDKPGFFVYQVSPGIEIFWNNFDFGVNHYLPLTQYKRRKNRDYTFHNIVEFNVAWQPKEALKVGFKPSYNYDKQLVNYKPYISYMLGSQIEIYFSPHYVSHKERGIDFALHIHFNKPKRGIKQTIFKEHRLFYSSQRRTTLPCVAEDIPIPPMYPPPTLPASDSQKQDGGWWPFFFLEPESDYSLDYQGQDAPGVNGVSPSGSRESLNSSNGSISGEWNDD